MRHKKELIGINDRTVTLLTEPDGTAGALLLQPTDSHDREELDKEVEWIEQHSSVRFTFVALHIDRWFDELAPWPAPPVFGKTPFGDGAADTLNFICTSVIPYISKRCSAENASGDNKGAFVSTYLGGYSLAGLFALWAATRERFDGVVGASPSVWYKDWMEYSKSHPSMAPRTYLSLGDRETHSKTKLLASVGDCIRAELETLQSQGVDATLEFNPGNHFQDNGVRTAKGFVWCMGG